MTVRVIDPVNPLPPVYGEGESELVIGSGFVDRTITVCASDPQGASIDRTFIIEVDPDVISIPHSRRLGT
ncbi:hypothetical protein [Microvirga puerhi]|uniref:IPT/TIG domain-containing protein n=1 Tax=Microvirga puerhi TaxID=2876078 RepID=A0ABS7VMC6_9HYPH|nr:hypothetical protein [Microvirga puerhi]MBZ6076137.1 hypothetical protein [Microvirga puerhi]